MGQQLFKVHLDPNDDNTDISNTISSDDLSFFFPLKFSSDLQQINNDQHISNLQIEYIKQIRNHLFLLTTSTKWQQMNTQINETFIQDILTLILDENKKILEEQNNRLAHKQELHTLLTTKLNDENNIKQSIFSESSIDSISDDEDIEKQLSYFGLQSLTLILFILIKSAEKHDPTLVYQILTLTNKLCEQLPMKCLSSSTNLLFKSLEPLTIYITELSLSSDRILSKQTIEIQFYFSIAKGSFNDLLPLLNKLIFNTNDIYNLQRLFINMNKYLTKTIKNRNEDEEKDMKELVSLNYLKSINAFPNTQLIKLNKEFFTGQMICSIILSHIDIENEIFNSSSKQLNSLSCDFHPNTFKYLFYIIEKLTKLLPSNETINHLLIICLKLFKNHLQLLSDLKSHISDLTLYVTNDELKQWFDLLIKLSTNENYLEEIAKEASKAFIYVIDINPLSLTETLDLIYRYIIENKYLILIEQLLIHLNKNELLLNWIETLLDKDKQIKSLEILFSFIDLYFTGEEKQKSEIKQILFSFQHLLLSQLIIQSEIKTLSNNEQQLSSVISQYLIYIFKYSIKQNLPMNDLLNSSLTGLCVMTETSKSFIYEDIQSIFLSILPLLTEYYLQNLNNEFLICLIGRICNVLIIGLPKDSLEIKHLNKFQSVIFDGGYVIDKNDDLLKSNLVVYSEFEFKEDLLMSIYNNVDHGRELILKLKSHIKDKQRLQQSIEELANDACAAMFSVYLKYYRRINLAKSELSRTDKNKPYSQLLSIYQYANRIQSLFATVKGQGGDCNELSRQIKIRTLFLLTSIKESHFIPIIQQDLSSTIVNTKPKIENQFQPKQSRWSKAKTIIKFLQACTRFRKFISEKKEINEEKYDYESLLSQSIDKFVYGDFYKSIIDQEKQLEINELEKCLHRQHQRANIRLFTYQFIKKFIENILNLNNDDQSLKTLSIYLPYLRKNDVDWSYFNDIHATNYQLKTELSNSFYSIIKLILPLTSLASNMFDLLNISYESIDISHLYSHQIIETLFNSFVYAINQSEHKSSLQLKLIGFNWFRLFVFKLSENIEIEKLRNISNEFLEEKQKLIFNKLILNEIKSVKQLLSTNSQEEENSLKNLSLCWFVQSNQTIDVYLNQYLVLLLRSMYFYKHTISICANNDYLEILISIYYHNKSKITQLLIIKLLGYLIPSISNDNDEKIKNLIEMFLLDALNTIGDKSNSKEIVSELIFMYRQIISMSKCSWEMKARELVFNSIKFHLNEKFLQTNEINQLVASLCILGGYIESFRLGSIVKIETDDEISFGLIININEQDKIYIIQYLQTNQIESISIDKLQHEIDALPSNLIDSNDSIIDILGSFIQIDTSTINNQSLILLELKRRSLGVLSHLLNDKKLIEIFMNKSYASSLAKLCGLKPTPPSDLGVFSKQNLEEYCLSLDNCKINKDDDLVSTIDQVSNEISLNESITKVLSKSMNGWRPYVFESEVEFFRKGRMGNDDFSIVPMPQQTVTTKATEECGINHRFHGRIISKDENVYYDFPTFIVDNLQLSEGNWYYCVRLSSGGLVQIGWATDGFSPAGRRTGVGDDKYSWSYDGSRGAFFNAEEFYGVYDDIRWKENDVCGCGIEINGKNTRIKYWLNGKLLGTAFAHDSIIASSSTECDLLPNGPTTTYYPAVSVSWESMLTTCELIFSPEDMQDCPLPNGYKPLFLPKVVQPENSIVDYPFNAYLIGDNPENFVVNKRTKSEMIILRDFVHEEHIETTFNLDDQYLSLPDNSDGFVLSLDNNDEITISFDFQILSADNQNDFSLFKLNSTEIPLKTTNENQKCVIILLLKEQQIKVHINNKSQKIFNYTFQNDTNEKLNIYLLPKISARIQNVAIWKYDLSEEEISRLFTYGVLYIKNEYEELKEYRKRVNRISFNKNQKQFLNELLLPFDEPFTEDIWVQKKIQPDDNDESKYFKSNENDDYSTVELFGNKTYLVLDRSNEEWCNYTFILYISIPQYPITDQKLTIISLNSKCEIYLTSSGKLCLEHKEEKVESSSSINLNEYFCLFIRVHEQSIQIYVNNNLEIDSIVTDDRFYMTSDRVDLFKENDLTKNSTNEDQLRISLKSISYLNRSISIDELQSPTLIEPTFEIIGRSLLTLGYKKHWIESVIKENGSKDLSIILRKRKEELIKKDLENEQKRYIKVFSKLYPSGNSEVIENVINASQLDTKEGVNEVNEHIFTYLISSQPIIDLPLDATKFGEDWFSQSVQDLDVPQTINQWLQDKKAKSENEDDIYKLLDLTELTSKKCEKTMKYSHENLSSEQYLKSRIACENGLITTYARSTINNMLKIWSADDSTLFPLEKFGDYSILKLIDYTKIHDKKESVDHVYSLIKSILKNEIKFLSEQNKTPLFNYLQKNIMIQMIEYLFKPSFINKTSEEQINFDFILTILNLFIELLSNKSLVKQHQVDQLIPMIFPTSLINLLFDLFLLIPTNQSKISVLYLFNSLFRLSELIILNNHIQQFFFQLLIDLSSDKISMNDSSKNKFQIGLTDLIYILLAKENNQLEQYRSNLPENIQNLLTTIDVINVWTDPTKQKLLPDKFLEQSSDVLGDSNKLNQEDFEKSNVNFNISADQELISLIKDYLLHHTSASLSDLIETFPTESVPTPSFYKRFILLPNIPADSIQIRARFIILLNDFIEPIIPTIDFSLPSGQNFITDQIRKIKLYLIMVRKFYKLRKALQETTTYNVDQLSINFDTVKASTDTENGENTMFYQAYQQLHKNAHTTFRQSNDQLWLAQYLEMHSTDAGGPYRDSITRICLDICSTRLRLFILCPNGRTSSGLNRDCWIPNPFPPNKSISIKFQKQYRFVGQLMGMAIRKKHYLDIKFPILLWKQLLKEQITVEDIEAIDAQSFTIINEMEKNMEETKSMGIDQDIDSVFSSIMSELRFDIVSSSGQTYELIPDGKDIPITSTNFKQYCKYYREYRLNEFNRQIQFIREGLYSVIPCYYLNLFTANDLEEMVCGNSRIDVEILKRNTYYGGDYTQSSPVIERFWTVMDGMFSDEQKKLFLIFVWGRSTLPVRDEDFRSKFIINPLYSSEGDVDKTLPQSHTCFFTIDLPAYSTTDVMYDRLNYAITTCSSIDGDGTLNGIANLGYIESDDDSSD